MKKPVVDYREFRFSRINEPRFAHVKLLGGWIAYFAMYFITENLIPYERCHVVHGFLDDLIPFNEYFAVFYVAWYFVVFGALLYTILYNIDSFKKLQTYIMLTQLIAMTVYILWPSRQELRPESFARDNLFTQVMGFIYAFDTPTGVCPSLHVGYSVAVASTMQKDESCPAWGKAAFWVFTVLVSLAVCFVKQHSAVDVIAAIPMCLAAEILVFGKGYWLPKLRHA